MGKQYVVIGLGTFGRNVVESLAAAGQSVLAIDRDAERVRRVAQSHETVVCADATDEAAMRELQVERVTHAVVAIGAEAIEASILSTALLRQIGVPRIVARGLSELHERVLRAVGADEVLQVEAEMGQRLARRLAEPNVLERMSLGEKAELAELDVPEAFVGKSLITLDIRRKFGVTVVAHRRGGEIQALHRGDEVLQSGDQMVVIGDTKSISRLASMA